MGFAAWRNMRLSMGWRRVIRCAWRTGRGVLSLDLKVIEGKVEMVTVNMGKPILTLADIPVDREWKVGSKLPERHEFLFSFDQKANRQ